MVSLQSKSRRVYQSRNPVLSKALFKKLAFLVAIIVATLLFVAAVYFAEFNRAYVDYDNERAKTKAEAARHIAEWEKENFPLKLSEEAARKKAELEKEH